MTRRAVVFKVWGWGLWGVDVFEHGELIQYAPHPTHAEALSHALAETGLLIDGTPYQPCGLGPCGMGHGHQGDCRC